MELPDSVLGDPRSAVVIPPIFLKQQQVLFDCHGLHSCFMKYFFLVFFSSRSRKLAPENVSQLEKCIDNDICLLKKEGGFAHVHMIY